MAQPALHRRRGGRGFQRVAASATCGAVRPSAGRRGARRLRVRRERETANPHALLRLVPGTPPRRRSGPRIPEFRRAGRDGAARLRHLLRPSRTYPRHDRDPRRLVDLAARLSRSRRRGGRGVRARSGAANRLLLLPAVDRRYATTLGGGTGADGADSWAAPEVFVRGVSIGAPPDPLNAAGQNWGLTPFNPAVLRRKAYAPFVSLLRANMRHAGALRIDHVMAMQRLFWIPHGRPAGEGTYVRYPLDDLLGIIALESTRQRCAVVGEDLGTVPDGFRERLAERRIFGCRLLFFEREPDGRFRPPAAYPPDALTSTGTHDML